MVITALIWGSNPLALRFLYLSPGPPSSAVLAAAQTVLAAFILLALRCAWNTYCCCGEAACKGWQALLSCLHICWCLPNSFRIAAVWEERTAVCVLHGAVGQVYWGQAYAALLSHSSNITADRSRQLSGAPCLPPQPDGGLTAWLLLHSSQ